MKNFLSIGLIMSCIAFPAHSEINIQNNILLNELTSISITDSLISKEEIKLTEKVEEKLEEPKEEIKLTKKVEEKLEEPKEEIKLTEKVEEKPEEPKEEIKLTEKVEEKLENIEDKNNLFCYLKEAANESTLSAMSNFDIGKLMTKLILNKTPVGQFLQLSMKAYEMGSKKTVCGDDISTTELNERISEEIVGIVSSKIPYSSIINKSISMTTNVDLKEGLKESIKNNLNDGNENVDKAKPPIDVSLSIAKMNDIRARSINVGTERNNTMHIN